VWLSVWSEVQIVCIWLGTNLIHDFTAVTFSVKNAYFHEISDFFVNFNAFTFIYDYEGFRVLSVAFVRILLLAMCHT